MLLKCDLEVIIGNCYHLTRIKFNLQNYEIVSILLACRKTSVGDELIKTIRESGVQTGKAKVMKLDNASLQSVREFVDKFKQSYDKLDILVNNGRITRYTFRIFKTIYSRNNLFLLLISY